MDNIKNLKIALLLGGTSPERAVSKSSGKSIYKTLNELGYKIKLIDPAYGCNQPEKMEDFFAEHDFSDISNKNCVDAINSNMLDDIDLVFLGLHGKWGEDGTIQSLLELRGKKYTGSGILASALAMDKNISKILFQHYDVKTPRWFVLDKKGIDLDTTCEKIDKFFGYPCIIKPNDQGSTIGLSVCSNSHDVKAGIEQAFKYSDKIIIEEFIPGREVTVGILDKEALPVLEIRPLHNYYDYECKYTTGMSEYLVPADFPSQVTIHLQHQALLAFQSVGCEVYGRVDFRVTNENKIYCLEVNTLPGMTSTSLVPKMAKAAGKNFGELLEKIIKLSL